MNNLFRKILLTVMVVFGLVVMVNSALAVVPPLTVQFENMPLFSEVNFMPGSSVTRHIIVTNGTGQAQTIVIKTANINDSAGLGGQMRLVIKEGTDERQNIIFSQFLSGNEFTLSNLGDGDSTQYDLTVSFNSAADNQYRGATLNFDILIGFQGEQEGQHGGGGTIYQSDNPGGGGGTGGYFSPTPTPTSSPEIAGESVSQETGQTGGQLDGGSGGFVAAAETGPAGSISPTPAAGAVAGESTCLPIPWWPFGYVLLLIILSVAHKMKKRVSAGGIVLQIVLFIAALLWWWFEPCGARFWVWPVLMLIVFLISLRFYLKKSSSEEITASEEISA